MEKLIDGELTDVVIGRAMRVHQALGPGLLESAYEACLAFELAEAGLAIERQKPLPLIYRDVRLDCGFKIDIMVESKLVIELKSVAALAPIHEAQTITYMKLAKVRVGLLFNFNCISLRSNFKRFVLYA